MTQRVPVLLLEPDQWRFRGMSTILEESGQIEVIGERDFSRILTMEEAPEGMSPRVGLVAHMLVIEYGLSVVAHIKAMFVNCGVLVHGDHESLHASAELMAAGAAGYFDTTDPPGYLPKAVMVVSQEKMWGPREAVALMAQRTIERAQRQAPRSILESGAATGVDQEEMIILRYLHEGLSNKEIGARLGLAEVTIKARLGRLYKKFGVSTRLQLLSAAIRRGLVLG